jgi:preprotein translocase subunit SecA
MSQVLSLFKRRKFMLEDSLYIECKDEIESGFERFLRETIAYAPRSLSIPKRLKKFVRNCNKLEESLQQESDDEIRVTLFQYADRMGNQGLNDQDLQWIFAAIREGSVRTLGKRHYDVQLMGAWAMMQGKLAEMQTGEGKSLVATLVATSMAASGAAVHVVTVNDYLTKRDAEEMAELYAFFGIKVGTIQEGMDIDARKAEYANPVTYVSNKELVFDYLKDRLSTKGQGRSALSIRSLYNPAQEPALILRGLHVAIIDEADSVLIDEARTPLIISASIEDPELEKLYLIALKIAREFEEHREFTINEKKEIWLSDQGLQRANKDFSAYKDFPLLQIPLWQQELIEKALKAIHCFSKDQHYIIRDDKVQIVDEFTGRIMPDRSWEQGLHQMIEAKEGVELTSQRKTLARMTYQRFFRRYLHLCGMSGTALEVAGELRAVYQLGSIRIPTNKRSRRKYLSNRLYMDEGARWRAIAEECKTVSAAGRSVLVGTATVEASEQLGQLLAALSVDHVVLNARQDAAESRTIAQAGKAGAVTIATNMAGRGTDIKLDESVEAAGGLHVIMSALSESYRVDRQLIGRSARQGNRGSTTTHAAITDELFTKFSPRISRLVSMVSRKDSKYGTAFVYFLSKWAQYKADTYNKAIRMQTVKQDRDSQKRLGFIEKPL